MSDPIREAATSNLGPLSDRWTRPLERVPGQPSRLVAVLTAVVATGIPLLALVHLQGASRWIELPLQTLLLLAFAALAVFDFRYAVTIAMIELAVAGAGGRWTVLPGGVSGRIALDVIVFARAIWLLAAPSIQLRRPVLGRYGLHALIVAAAIPLIWIPIGLLNGNHASDVFHDANGYVWVAFSLVFVAMAALGESGWVRRSLLVACAANALFMGALVVLVVTGLVPLTPDMRAALIDGSNNLSFGGAIGILPSGAGRLYLASGVYLQVGVALVAWELLQNPRRAWPWALYGILIVDMLASYTRGFWLAGAAALVAVLVLGARDLRQPAFVILGTGAIAAAITLTGAAAGFSLPDYVLQRAASTFVSRPASTPVAGAPSGSPSASLAPGSSAGPTPGSSPQASPDPGTDVLGEISNGVRVVQTRVLTNHIRERPLLGSGLGAIASDYPYGNIPIYENAYLDIAFKIGLLGAALFLSFLVRLLVDGVRGRLGWLEPARGVERRALAVPVAIVGTILAASATDPYLLAAYGLMPILAAIAWLDPTPEAFAASVPRATGAASGKPRVSWRPR